MPFRGVLAELGVEHHSMDVEQRASGVHFVADLQDMALVPEGHFDTVLCSEVSEHVPHPERALAEIARVLHPGGKVLVTVPYLSRLHEEPHDYYRHTSHGLQFLLEGAGFRVLEIAPTDSVFSFLGHQVSTAVVVGLWHVPLLRQVAFWMNAVGCSLPCYWADRVLGIGRKLPRGCVAVAEKRV
jgi:SAM-dependent methyltransferase